MTSKKMWKADHEQGDIREVLAEPWPGEDAEGDAVFENTHFVTQEQAVKCLLANLRARIKFSADRVTGARQELADANEEAGHLAIHASSVWEKHKEKTS